MDIHWKSIVLRSTADIFKFLCRIVIEFFNLKDPTQLMQKTYLFPLQFGMPLAMHLKSVGYMDTVLFPTIGNAVNVQSPDMVSQKSITENILSQQPILVIIGHPDTKLLLT